MNAGKITEYTFLPLFLFLPTELFVVPRYYSVVNVMGPPTEKCAVFNKLR